HRRDRERRFGDHVRRRAVASERTRRMGIRIGERARGHAADAIAFVEALTLAQLAKARDRARAFPQQRERCLDLVRALGFELRRLLERAEVHAAKADVLGRALAPVETRDQLLEHVAFGARLGGREQLAQLVAAPWLGAELAPAFLAIRAGVARARYFRGRG